PSRGGPSSTTSTSRTTRSASRRSRPSPLPPSWPASPPWTSRAGAATTRRTGKHSLPASATAWCSERPGPAGNACLPVHPVLDELRGQAGPPPEFNGPLKTRPARGVAEPPEEARPPAQDEEEPAERSVGRLLLVRPEE